MSIEQAGESGVKMKEFATWFCGKDRRGCAKKVARAEKANLSG
jgi:hypothetical protein